MGSQFLISIFNYQLIIISCAAMRFFYLIFFLFLSVNSTTDSNVSNQDEPGLSADIDLNGVTHGTQGDALDLKLKHKLVGDIVAFFTSKMLLPLNVKYISPKLDTKAKLDEELEKHLHFKSHLDGEPVSNLWV